MIRKGQYIYNTLAKEIIDNDELQKDWLIPNEESLVGHHIQERLFQMSDTEFDEIMDKCRNENLKCGT